MRLPKRSASVSLPLGPSKTYCFSPFSQGSSRPCRLSSSRSRVHSFSFAKCALRALSHSAGDTTFCCFISIVLVAIVILLRLNWSGNFLRDIAGTQLYSGKFLDEERGQSAGRRCTAGNQRRCNARWAHIRLLLSVMAFTAPFSMKTSFTRRYGMTQFPPVCELAQALNPSLCPRLLCVDPR